jgi:hypothetical protein
MPSLRREGNDESGLDWITATSSPSAASRRYLSLNLENPLVAYRATSQQLFQNSVFAGQAATLFASRFFG